VLFVRSMGLALGTALLVAVGVTALQGGFGAGEVPLVVAYAIPLVLVTTLGSLGIRSIGRSRPVWAYTSATLGGVVLGLAWTYVVALFLGGWFLAISVPPFPVWIAAAVAGLAAGVPQRSRQRATLLPLGSAVLSAAIVSGALIGIQAARQHPGFVAVFGSAVTVDQRNEVWQHVLGTTTARGTDLLPGIQAVGTTSYDSREAIVIEFFPNATDAEIARVRQALEASPYIDRVVVEEG
jgi:hypothetical protein